MKIREIVFVKLVSAISAAETVFQQRAIVKSWYLG